ncbi:MAG TPA: DUF3999 family protein [Candidatus Acidoferrales bacterium]|nr:DUF3999 family protein [Candidatus Acidoferrales bacterium]
MSDKPRRRSLVSRILPALALVGLGVACLAGIAELAAFDANAASTFPPGWSHWRYSREMNLAPIERRTLVSASIPEEIYSHSANRLADLRVVDDRGREVPYALDVPTGETRVEHRSAKMREQSFVPGEFSQFILDVNLPANFYNAVKIDTRETDFLTWAEVAVSDDAREWRIVCDRAPLFRFNKQNLQGTQTLHYSDTNARYIRLRALDGAKRFQLSSVEVLYEVSSPAERVAVSAPPAPIAFSDRSQSAWEADLPAQLPIDEVRFETEEPEFSRSVTVETSEDRNDWSFAGSGEIYRFRRDDALREWLNVGFAEDWSPHWRIRVANGSNSPLAGARVTFYMTPRRLVFHADPVRRYFILYGETEAKRPEYDLARTVHFSNALPAPEARIGPEEVNSAFVDPRPWTERNLLVLWICVIIAAGVLAVVALRSLRVSASGQAS